MKYVTKADLCKNEFKKADLCVKEFNFVNREISTNH